jgi:peptidoglycan/xylan/chitin deacetylase (PgdA/CDA1 family)
MLRPTLGRIRAAGAALAARAAGPERLARLARLRGVRALCLNYHCIRGEEMAQHLGALEALFDVVSVDEAWRRSREPAPAGGRIPVALTYDDGKRSHLTEVARVLAERGLPATFFVTTEPSRTGRLHWFDLAERIRRRLAALAPAERAPARKDVFREELREQLWEKVVEPRLPLFQTVEELKQLGAEPRDALLHELAEGLGVDVAPADDDERPLSPEEVGALVRLGFDVGSHSVTHPVLTLESEDRVWHELSDSRTELAEWTGRPVRHIAYPNGNGNDTIERLARKAGYEAAWSTIPLWLGGRENPYLLPRVQIHPGYDAGQIALKCAVATFPVLANPDGTGRAYRRDPARLAA